MDTMNARNSHSAAALEQWMTRGTVSEDYFRSVLGEELRAVSPSGWGDKRQEIVVVRGAVTGDRVPASTKPAKRSSPHRRSARRK